MGGLPGHGLEFHAVPILQHVVIQGGRVAGEDDPARQGLQQVQQIFVVLPAVIMAVAAFRGPRLYQVGGGHNRSVPNRRSHSRAGSGGRKH